MSNDGNDNRVVVLAEKRGQLMPVTRLISRPSVCIVNGVLSAVKQVVRSAA
jgi:hypothetical protein